MEVEVEIFRELIVKYYYGLFRLGRIIFGFWVRGGMDRGEK